jgi:hypothetical protein
MFNINYYSLPPLISAATFVILGGYVLYKNARSFAHIAFALNCFATFWWQFSWFILFNLTDPKLASILIKAGYSGIIFIPITFWHFYVVFCNDKKAYRSVVYAYSIGLVFLALLWLSSLFINGYFSYYWGYYPKAGYLHPIYLLFLFYIDIKCVYVLINALKEKEAPIKNQQIKYLILALLFYNVAATDFSINYGIGYYPLGFVFILISIGTIAYSILKHHLLDINIIIKKTVIYSLITAVLSGVFIAVVYLVESFFRGLIKYQSIWAAILAAFMVAIIFQPLKNKIQEVVNRLFSRNTYDYRDIIKNLSKKSTSVINLNQLLDLVINSISETLKTNKISIYLLRDGDDRYRLKRKK